MTSNGNDTFLKESYMVGNSVFNDYTQALIQSINEQNSTSAGSGIETVEYWDFG